ncbi:DUF3995 domain-containing protein [Leptospira santarosai]|uniref:DUF3995 domain-containing protein n=1 Tax=Leptospira santarosai TaxID=28183 RepID=UPI00349F9D9B
MRGDSFVISGLISARSQHTTRNSPIRFSIRNVLLSAMFLFRAIGDFRLVGFFKKIRGTKFAKNDTAFFSPLCLLLSILLFVSAL